jgi:hypothetical protein
MAVSVDQVLAAAACDAFFAAAELPTRWATATPVQRATFMACAGRALAEARAGRRSDFALAVALHAGFWDGCPDPIHWTRMGGMQREVFFRMAQAVRGAGEALRAGRRVAA